MTRLETRPRVLIVDDEETVRTTVEQFLVDRGYDVLALPDGSKALFRQLYEQVDAVVLDFQMPGLDGLDVLHRLKAKYPRTVVIMVTGVIDADGTIEGAARELGVAAFLKKPVRLAKLEEALLNALGPGAVGCGSGDSE